jgi:hypothetical protein
VCKTEKFLQAAEPKHEIGLDHCLCIYQGVSDDRPRHNKNRDIQNDINDVHRTYVFVLIDGRLSGLCPTYLEAHRYTEKPRLESVRTLGCLR